MRHKIRIIFFLRRSGQKRETAETLRNIVKRYDQSFCNSEFRPDLLKCTQQWIHAAQLSSHPHNPCAWFYPNQHVCVNHPTFVKYTCWVDRCASFRKHFGSVFFLKNHPINQPGGCSTLLPGMSTSDTNPHATSSPLLFCCIKWTQGTYRRMACC